MSDSVLIHLMKQAGFTNTKPTKAYLELARLAMAEGARAERMNMNSPPLTPVDELDDDHPLALVNAQIQGLLVGEGAGEDHDNVISFLMATGLPRSTVDRMHHAIVFGDTKVRRGEGEIAGWRHSLTHTLHETEEGVQLADADSCAEPLYLGPPKDLEVQVEVLNNLLNTSLGMLADFALWCEGKGGGSLDDLYLQITKRDGPLRTKLDQALVDARARWAHLSTPAAPVSDEREAFEATFPPIKSAVQWDGSRYVVDTEWINSYAVDRFIGQWDAWQARASLRPAPAQPMSEPIGVAIYSVHSNKPYALKKYTGPDDLNDDGGLGEHWGGTELIYQEAHHGITAQAGEAS